MQSDLLHNIKVAGVPYIKLKVIPNSGMPALNVLDVLTENEINGPLALSVFRDKGS